MPSGTITVGRQGPIWQLLMYHYMCVQTSYKQLYIGMLTYCHMTIT